MTEDLTKVPGGTTDGVASATPAQGGVAPATPTQPPADAASAADVEAKYKADLAKYQEDLNKLKSASQRREGELQRTLTQRDAEYKAELEKVRLSTMDDEERKIYEIERNRERVNELQAELDRVNAEREEQAAINNTFAFFLQKGVPANALVNGQGLDALVVSGWDYISNRLAQLEAAAANAPAPKTPPQEPPKAPPVTTGTGTPVGSPTWDDLIKQYGSMDEVFNRIEQGRLSRDVLPGLK